MDSAVSRPPDIAARFDVRLHDGLAIYIRDGCAPEDLAARFLLHIDPVDPADLPEDRRQYGFDNRNFTPNAAAVAWPRPSVTRFGGSCLVLAPLPGYPIRRVHTGQFVYDDGGGTRYSWEGEIDLDDAPGRAGGAEPPRSPRARD